MQGLSEKHPALHFLIIKGNTDTLVVRLHDMEPRILFRKYPEVLQHLCPVIGKILTGDRIAHLNRFRRLLQIPDQRFDGFSFLLQTRHRADNLHGDVGAVI